MAVEQIARVSLTTADAERLATFYVEALGFDPVATEMRSDANFARLMGLEAAMAKVHVLRLGRQTLELLEFSDRGLAYPAERASDDRLFQHLAIVVADMNAAYACLTARRDWEPITTPAPQLLPASSGGVRAFKFRDPEGHPLELLEFPPKRQPRTASGSPGSPFLGIDHSAIVVSDTARSRIFYGLLGFKPSYRSLNQGPEQDHLDGLRGVRVEVTGLAPPAAVVPHLELLCYQLQAVSSAIFRIPANNDVAATRLLLEVDDVAGTVEHLSAAGQNLDGLTLEVSAEAALLRDPDGHALVLSAAQS